MFMKLPFLFIEIASSTIYDCILNGSVEKNN